MTGFGLQPVRQRADHRQFAQYRQEIRFGKVAGQGLNTRAPQFGVVLGMARDSDDQKAPVQQGPGKAYSGVAATDDESDFS